MLSVGIFFVVALPCSILGIAFSRKGKKKVETEETRKHGGLVQAGFVTGIVGTVLGALAAAGWILLFVLDDEFVDDLDDPNNRFDATPAALLTVSARLAVRLAL